jgi:hypothetical protein
VVFIGPTGGIREVESTTGGGAPVSLTNTTSSSVLSSDVAIYWSSCRQGLSTPTITPGSGSANTLQMASTTAELTYSILADQTMPGGALSVVSAFAAAANGATAAQVIVMGASTGVGSVTSVGLTVPSWQSVSGSPVTSAGTLAVTDNNQNANLVFAGPSSGTAAAPTFRALVSADVPSSLTNPMTTKGDIIYGGVSGAPTRLAAGTSGQVLQTNGSSAAPSWVAAGGGGSGALTQIAQQVLGSSAASVTFFSIPGTYTSLILKFACKERAGRAIAFCSSTVTRPPTTTTTTSTTLAEDRQAARAGRSTLRLSSTTPTLASRRTRWL